MRKISVRRVLRAMPEIAVGSLIAFGIGITALSLFFVALEILS